MEFLTAHGLPEPAREPVLELLENVLVHRQAALAAREGLITADELVTLVYQHLQTRFLSPAGVDASGAVWDDSSLRSRLSGALLEH